MSHFSALVPAIRPRYGRSKFEAPKISSRVSPYGILPLRILLKWGRYYGLHLFDNTKSPASALASPASFRAKFGRSSRQLQRRVQWCPSALGAAAARIRRATTHGPSAEVLCEGGGFDVDMGNAVEASAATAAAGAVVRPLKPGLGGCAVLASARRESRFRR